MKRLVFSESRALIPALLLLVWLGSTAVWGQVAAPTPPDSGAAVERDTGNAPAPAGAPTPGQKSQFHGWFNRSGSGLIIFLTPFATAVTLLLLFLILLSPLLLRAGRREKKGYFRAVPYARQRRYS